MNRDNVCEALGRIAWAYFFLHIGINLGAWDVLPDWLGYVLIYRAIALLPELRDLVLLKPFALLLGLWEGAVWVWGGLGGTLSLYPLNLVVTMVSLYFHFQLLTDLAQLADKFPETAGLAPPLLRLRTARTLLVTVTVLALDWLKLGIFAQVLAVLLLFGNLAVCLLLLLRLFALRRQFRSIEEISES